LDGVGGHTLLNTLGAERIAGDFGSGGHGVTCCFSRGNIGLEVLLDVPLKGRFDSG
jgi:hypothetical protein